MSTHRFAANLGWLFTEVPMLERPARAAAAGFGAVELPDVYAHDLDALDRAVRAAGLSVASMDTPEGDREKGERGLASIPGRVPDFEASVRRALDAAEVLEPEVIHIPAGISRGPWARSIYIANLKRACEMAPERRFAIEPMNRRDCPGYHLSDSTDAQAVIGTVGAKNLALQLDLYHLQAGEGDVTRRLEALSPVLAHVQVAGCPKRNEPDRGELWFAHLLSALDRVGYAGWIGAEYRPSGRTEDSLAWLATP